MGYFNYHRRLSSVVRIGDTPLGGSHPIRIQSMVDVSTMDTEASVSQAIRLIKAGAEYVRFTAQNESEALNLRNIRRALTGQGYHTPLIADIHFNPEIAVKSASIVEKVRINPGNFTGKRQKVKNYPAEVYAKEQQTIRSRFVPFLKVCRENNTAIRIGVNHGSLSDRIMSRYGDTVEGMVESCLEFLRLCVEEQFDRVVVSIKASNTVVMIRAVRLLVRTMEAERMYYPLHLGVTEAGEGEDGRIKSAVGIGALLVDGIGDTIRVSLSEAPEAEIPVARKLVFYISSLKTQPPIEALPSPLYDSVNPSKRKSREVFGIGGDNPPVVISEFSNDAWMIDDRLINPRDCPVTFISMSYKDLNDETIRQVQSSIHSVIIFNSSFNHYIGEARAFMHRLLDAGCETPVIFRREYDDPDFESVQIKAAVDFGTLLTDGFGDGILLCHAHFDNRQLQDCMYSILQAARVRISKTEYISCPGCGRTLFNLHKTIAEVKSATSHLTGLKIGIMGCIVNGPGEMADADYGYIGAGRGRIHLYKGRTCILKNIPEAEAVKRLLDLIESP